MRLGLTGTRDRALLAAHADAVRNWLDLLALQADEYTTGACVEFDAFAASYLLDTRPDALHRLVIPWDTSQVDWSIVDRFELLVSNAVTGDVSSVPRVVVEYMPAGTTFKQRNQRLVEHSDAFAGVVAYPELDGHSRRSGSWQTLRLARTAGMEPAILTLSELAVLA